MHPAYPLFSCKITELTSLKRLARTLLIPLSASTKNIFSNTIFNTLSTPQNHFASPPSSTLILRSNIFAHIHWCTTNCGSLASLSSSSNTIIVSPAFLSSSISISPFLVTANLHLHGPCSLNIVEIIFPSVFGALGFASLGVSIVTFYLKSSHTSTTIFTFTLS